MTQFKIGDRVKVFPNGAMEFEGKITGKYSKEKPMYFVTEDGFYSCHNDSPFHAEQMRLIKKELINE